MAPQSPDARDRNRPLPPPPLVGLYPQGFDPRAAPATQRGGSPVPFATDEQLRQTTFINPPRGLTPAQVKAAEDQRVAAGHLPLLGGLLRFQTGLAPTPEEMSSPLYAYGPAGELAGPISGVGHAAGKVVDKVRGISPAKAAGSFADAVGQKVPERVVAQSVGQPEGRHVLSSKDLFSLEDAFSAKQKAGYYKGGEIPEAQRTDRLIAQREAELVRDVQNIERVRRVVAATEPSALQEVKIPVRKKGPHGEPPAATEGLSAEAPPSAVTSPTTDSGFWQDNPTVSRPGPEADAWMRDAKNTPTAGYKTVLVDPKEIAKLPGARGEERNVGRLAVSKKKLADLTESMKREGFHPDERPLVMVEQDGSASLYEGNHRIRAAVDAGIDQVPVEVRYMGGSETLPNVWKPNAKAADTASSARPYKDFVSRKSQRFAKKPKAEAPVAAPVGPETVAATPAGRYVVETGKVGSYIRDTQTGKLLGVMFDGPGAADRAAVEAAKRNAVPIQRDVSARQAAAMVPPDNELRKLSNKELNALRVVVTDPLGQQKIDALLGERAFQVAPEAMLDSAASDVPKEILQQVKVALRDELGTQVDPEFLRQAPGMAPILDDLLASRKIEPNLGNRNALAQRIIDQARADNLRNIAESGAKATGIPAVDKANIKLAHAAGDLKAGVHPAQVYEDVAAAIRDALLEHDAARAARYPGMPEAGVPADVEALRAQATANRATLGPEQQALLTEEGRVQASATQVRERMAAEAEAARQQVGRESPPVSVPPRPESPFGEPGTTDLNPAWENVDPTTLQSGQLRLPEQRNFGGTPPPQGPAAPGGTGGGNLPPMTPGGPSMPQPLGKRLQKAATNLLSVAGNLLGSTRNIASGDVSNVFSQSFPMAFKTPTAWVRGNIEGLGYLFKDEATFNRAQADLELMVNKLGITVGPEKDQLFYRRVGTTSASTADERFLGVQRVRDLVDGLLARVPALKVFLAPLRAGLKYLRQTEQEFSGGLNAVATYGLLAQVRGLNWLYRRTRGYELTIPEVQGIANNINILLGRGYNIKRAGVDNGTLVALTKIIQGLGFAPENSVARARIIPEAGWRMARLLNDARQGHAPRPEDLDYVHGAGAFLAATLGTMALVAKVMNVAPVLDSGNTNYLKIDLGKKSKELGVATTVLEAAGFHTQTYNGHVYLDPGLGVGQDMRLLTQLIGPAFGHLPSDSKGHAWNPYDAKGVDPSAMELLLHFAENRLHPGAAAIAGGLEGRPVDLADPTQNPITSLWMTMYLQSGLSASGLSDPGGPVRLPFENLSAGEKEKRRIAENVAPPPSMDSLSPDRQKQFLDITAAAVRTRIAALVQSQTYIAATDADKKDLIDKNTAAVTRDTKRNLAIRIATTGAPEEVLPALVVALGQSPANLDKGNALVAAQTAGRLTPEVIAALDALRKQPDEAKPNYDPTVKEYIEAKGLVERWLATPEFIIGTKAEWDIAAAAAKQLRLLRQDAEGRKVDPNRDEQINRFYREQGGPLFTRLYNRAGDKNQSLVDQRRKDMQQDRLWRLVATSAAKLDHP